MIARMSTDQCNKPFSPDQDIVDPDWQAVQTAIRTLDGEHATGVFLYCSDEIILAITGGNNGLYLVALTFDGTNTKELYNPKAPPGKVDILSAGAWTSCDLDCCVDLASALKAANTFFHSQEAEESLSWRKTPGQ